MTLTGSNVRAFRDRAALTQARLARLVGVQPNSVARWERNEVRVPEPTARLIRLLAVLANDEREAAGGEVERSEIAESVWAPLTGYLEGNQSSDAARAALKLLRREGRRGQADDFEDDGGSSAR